MKKNKALLELEGKTLAERSLAVLQTIVVALPAIKNNLEAGRLKIIDFYPNCSIRFVEETDLQAIPDLSKVVCNVNTPNDWSMILKG